MMKTLATLLLKSTYKFYRNTYIDCNDEKQDVCMDTWIYRFLKKSLMLRKAVFIRSKIQWKQYSQHSSIVKYIIFIIIII